MPAIKDGVMINPKSAIPAEVQLLPPAQKLERLRLLNPSYAAAMELLIDDCLERGFQGQLHGGQGGGLKLKSEKSGA
jgi:hypothetical protein